MKKPPLKRIDLVAAARCASIGAAEVGPIGWHQANGQVDGEGDLVIEPHAAEGHAKAGGRDGEGDRFIYQEECEFTIVFEAELSR